METTLRDLRYAWRNLRRQPAFSLVSILALMLGLASTTVIFSVIDGVLLRPLPYPEAERLVSVAQMARASGAERDAVAPANYVDWAAQNDVFAQMAAARGWQGNLSEGETPERVRVATVTASFFQVFSTPPLLGRTFLPSDEQPGRAQVIVLSQGLWERRFGADRSIIGREIRFDGQPHTVVGVMPANFSPDGYGELWVPSPFGVPTHSLRPMQDPRTLRDSNYLDVWARLKSGVTLQQAEAQMNTIMARLAQQNPNADADLAVKLTPLHEDKVGSLRPALFVLAAAVAFLLLIGCANVANLQLARAANRAREISIRTALGASRARLVRQLLTESILLSVIGGALGVILAAWAIPVLVALAPPGLASFKEITLNRGVLIFSAALSLLTGVPFGLAPAFFASTANPNDSLGEGERGSSASHHCGRSALIAAEVGLTLVLLVAAGLMVKSFSKLLHVDPGFAAENLLVFDLGLPPATDDARNFNFYQQVSERLAALPGVTRVGAVSRLPMSGGNSSRDFNVAGLEKSQSADIRIATPEYFRAMGVPLLRGRLFDNRDTKNAPQVAVINDAAARAIFPNEDPIGKFIENFGPDGERLQIIGVVGNVRHLALETAPRAELYQPLGQGKWPRMFFVVKTVSSQPLALLPSVQNVVRAIDPNVALGNPRTMEDTVARSLLKRKFTMTLLMIFAGLAVALASVGLYGVMSYSVSQRTREIGIRMAIGAQRSDVLRLVVRQGMQLTVLGIALGLLAAFGLTRLMATMLYGVSASDAATFASVSLLLALVATIACWLPARKATRVNPIVALRTE